MNDSHQLSLTFTESFIALHIAESLVSFDIERSADDVLAIMIQKKKEAIGVSENGCITGFALREEIASGSLREAMRPIMSAKVLPHTAPLHEVIRGVIDHGVVFVTLLGEPIAVVLPRDLQKSAVRMWLFGLIMLIDENLTRTISLLYPEDSWAVSLTEARVKKARDLCAERMRRKLPASLLESLQLSDKFAILIKNASFRNAANLGTVSQSKLLANNLETLRNDIAHNQPLNEQDLKMASELIHRLNTLLHDDLVKAIGMDCKGPTYSSN